MTIAADSEENWLAPQNAAAQYLSKSDFDQLLQTISDAGYDVVGPTIEQESIVYGPVRTSADLPIGWTDLQEPGRYRLERRKDDAWFGFVVGPHSWKKYLFPPVSLVASADRTDGHWQFSVPVENNRPFAFLGVRACELAAMRIQDKVFTGGPFVDAQYQRRRQSALIIAVNCTQAASTCFCTSMNSGPECRTGFDLAMTELPEGFLLRIGTSRGAAVLHRVPLREATVHEADLAAAARQQAQDQISRTFDTRGVAELLPKNLHHPQWQDVANRCLSCANCTMVCPTCFCSTVREVSDLTGDHVDRERRWDSCFNPDFSYMHSGTARDSIQSRYRQWLTHKLSAWHEQFGTSGCVGCGRCITWCPVGIDLTAEVSLIVGSPADRTQADAVS